MKTNKQYNLTYKITSFTLPELVIAMLLTAILFSMAAKIYLILLDQSNLIYKKNNFYADYYLTKKVLERDIEQAFFVSLSEDKKYMKIQMNSPQEKRKVIIYQLDANYILRNNGHETDTMNPGGSITFAGTINDSIPLINFIKIRHLYNTTDFFTYLQKKYSSEQVLNFPIQNKILP